MFVNSNRTDLWKKDIAASVDLYNSWFMKFAPKVYRDNRVAATKRVEDAMALTLNLSDLTPSVLKAHPEILSMLRMATAPPIARDRLIGLADVSQGLVHRMEEDSALPTRLSISAVDEQLGRICALILTMADRDILTWLGGPRGTPSRDEIYRASTIIADRLCGAQSDPMIRNAQEKRQLEAIRTWLKDRGYVEVVMRAGLKFNQMGRGTFAFRVNVPANIQPDRSVKIPVDAVVIPRNPTHNLTPLLIEAKSAGDFTNPNKRRKEEATKINQLKNTYGTGMRYILFLCGYFNSSYLGYEAAEGIDWVWEHRIDDLDKFGL